MEIVYIESALKWSDFKKVNDGDCFKKDLWQLNVCRKLRRDGGKFLLLDKAIENRKIPCADLLVQALLYERERQLAVVGSEEALSNRQIVQAKKDMVRTEGVSVFPPDKLNQCGRETITAAGIDERLIRLPDGDDGIIEILMKCKLFLEEHYICLRSSLQALITPMCENRIVGQHRVG